MFWILILSVLIFGVLIYAKGWADGQKALLKQQQYKQHQRR